MFFSHSNIWLENPINISVKDVNNTESSVMHITSIEYTFAS
jgi:hypothetical protein